MYILIRFSGTNHNFNRYGAKPYSSELKNVGIKQKLSGDEPRYEYYFNGPGTLNTFGWTTEKIYNTAIKILPDIILSKLSEIGYNEKLHICVRGHSRGGTVAVRVYRYLLSQFGSKSSIELTLKISDPYYGPTAKNENALTRLTKQKSDLKSNTKINTTIVVYAVQTLLRCTPQQIAGIDTVIIVNTGHGKSGLALSDPPKEKGLYLAYIQRESDFCKYKLVSRTSLDIKEYFDFIYKYGKATQSNRWRLFVSILIQKLGLKSYDDLEKIADPPDSILFPNVKNEFDEAKKRIENSLFLRVAFNIAINLFLPGGIFSGLGGRTFREHLSNAKNYVCGFNHNNYDGAIAELNLIINKPGRPVNSIKTVIADTLIKRIKKWYNIKLDNVHTNPA